MESIRVIVAEDNPAQREALVENLNKQRGIRVIGIAADGAEAVRLVEEKEPQVLICDMVMPQMDGFAVLERVSLMLPAKRPKVIALTALSRDDFISRAINLGASYYMVKPVNLTTLVQQIRELAGQMAISQQRSAHATPPPPQGSMENYVSGLLLRIGVPPHINGYKYIRQAVMMAVEQPDVLDRITKGLYPAVAESFNTTSSRVERCIRHAVCLTWERGGAAAFEQLMERGTGFDRVRPTNCEFIALLSERIRFWLANGGQQRA